MKNTLILFVFGLFLLTQAQAQEVKGKLTVSGDSKKELWNSVKSEIHQVPLPIKKVKRK